MQVMTNNGQGFKVPVTGLGTGLGGMHWGFLPALFCLPWVVSSGQWQAGWLVVMAGLMASYDLAVRRIPNALNGLTALSGLAWGLISAGPAGGLEALLGGLTGFGLMAVIFFMGAVGAGDVKALGALSTFLTPFGALSLFTLTALSGGVLAIGVMIAAGRIPFVNGRWQRLRTGSAKMTMPYGLAIWVGLLALMATGGIR